METLTPCRPSPCGLNAQCRELNGVGSCTCLPDFFGDPYDGCRPECTIDSDCLTTLACVRSKCENPCPGTCGQNAECQVINHLPSCSCLPNYTGNPFQFCGPQPRKSNACTTIMKVLWKILTSTNASIINTDRHLRNRENHVITHHLQETHACFERSPN